jgi:hypothetical protein
MIYSNTSIKEVISKVYRDLDVQAEDRWADMIEWAGEALDHMGSYHQYLKVKCMLPVKERRAKLPCGFHKLIDIAHNGAPMKVLTGTFDHNLCDSALDPDLRRYETPADRGDVSGFSINPGYINVNFDEGEVAIAFLSIPVDEEGFPLVPDDVSVREAVFRYIAMKLYYPRALAGKIPQGMFQQMEYKWQWYCSQARAAMNMPDLKTMESIKDTFTSLIPHIHKADNFFSNLNQPSTSRYNNF